MSWFDTKNFANLATKALKEAQKKIDKVLDIQEDEDAIEEDGTAKCSGIKSSSPSKLGIGTSPVDPPLEDMVSNNVEISQTSATKKMLEEVAPQETSDLVETEAAPSSESIVIIDASISKASELEDKSPGDETLKSSIEEVDKNTVQSCDDIPYELQTIDSDSTQSFEDVQLQSKFGADTNSDKCITIRQNCENFTNTSNDEMETATSSDIEIISNPNGDGSSTASNTTRTSPSKIEKTSTESKNKTVVSKVGHCREPSEISILSIDSPSEDEVEKLLKRISDLNSIIEARELRLLQSEQTNSELQERNNELLSLVGMQPSEEYTKRLSALEKKFQNCIRERDSLRSEVKELQTKIPKSDITNALAESQSMVAELRQEGEKLSKEILQQSNIIKKLRSKDKTLETQLKSVKEELTSASDEVERLKKTLSAKEEVERTQIEAVHKMSSENQKLDKENSALRSKLDDVQQKLNTLQNSFHAVKGELQQRSKQESDISISRTTLQTAEREKQKLLAEKEELERQIKDFADKLRSTEISAMKREKQLRDENRNIMDRLEAAEFRAETSTQEISQSTIPLMRHLESLQQTLNQRTTKWNKDEKCLLEKIDDYEGRLQSLQHVEEKYKRKIASLKERCQETEDKLAQAIMREENAKIALQLELNQKQTEYNRKIAEVSQELEQCKSKIKLLEDTQMQQYMDDTESKVSVERLQREQEQCSNSLDEFNHQSVPDVNRNSPISTTGYSLEDGMCGGSIDWQQQEDDLDCLNNGRSIPGQSLGFHYVGNNTANNFEYLQSMVKQREGELAQAQWELSRVQAEKGVLQEELSQLSLEIEQVKEKLLSYELMEQNFNELQIRYDALLQMYGEKVERCEELQLDLKECKEAYKIQIQELLTKSKT
ncbi:TATA element modulatory factor [Haematobia irritans]|uniref:TATA element modulatory factor n=1 Tax=Haematobia irritans TaxID=7368 RepID=UPI003F50C3F7